MVYPAENGFSAGCCWLGGLDWQTNVAHRSKQELCLSPGARSRGEEGRRTRLRHEEASVARHVPDKRGGRPGNEPHSTRPDQSRQVQTSMHDDFYFWKAKRCQQTHVRPCADRQTDRHLPLLQHTRYTVYSTVALSPYHRRPQTRRSQKQLFCRFLCLCVCVSVSLSVSLSLPLPLLCLSSQQELTKPT